MENRIVIEMCHTTVEDDVMDLLVVFENNAVNFLLSNACVKILKLELSCFGTCEKEIRDYGGKFFHNFCGNTQIDCSSILFYSNN